MRTAFHLLAIVSLTGALVSLAEWADPEVGRFRRREALQDLGWLLLYVAYVPFVAIGYLMDVFANVTIASIVFLEPPREWLVTDRLQRHMHKSKGWRFWLAKYICDRLLDVFDPSGDHC